MCPIYVSLVSKSPIVHFVSLYDEPFLKYRPFWDKCPEWPQTDLEPYKVKLQLHSLIPKFHSVLMYDQPFSRYSQFGDKCTKWPQNDLEPYTIKGTPYMLLVSTSPKFHSVSPYDQSFRDTGQFETRVPNDPKMSLNTTRLYVSHICVTSIQKSHSSLRFTLRWAVFKIQAIVRQVPRMTPNWPSTLQGQ